MDKEEEIVYIKESKNLPFKVDDEALQTFSDDLDLEVLFSVVPNDEQQEKIKTVLGVWLMGAMSGLFAYDFQVMESSGLFLLPSEEKPDIDDKLLFWSFEKVRCHTDVLYGLMQSLLYIHSNVAKISSVTYE